ncbi:DsrE family protein [Candidatus Peregrinibacteria bacterium]|nr:DsrE family protein [Candidatus Peregrinibacteria bacterium]
MKLGIIISQTNSETLWNAFRLANFSIKQGDKVKIFLVGEGVEYETGSSEKFNIAEQATEFLKSENAKILACGTCLKSRNQEATETCPMSTMKDLYELVRECDKILTF